MSSNRQPDKEQKDKQAFSRRGFIQGIGAGGAIGTGILEREAQAAPAGVMGPGEIPITLTINGKPRQLSVEPRVTLLDALRDRLDMTGAKRVCDRGTCGSCTVLMDGKVVYACSVLAVDAQGRQIQTIEGLTAGARPHPVVTAFVNHDAQQCGFCTPGFVVATAGLLQRNPNPTPRQVDEGLGGNLCRCGTYVGMKKAVMDAAKQMRGGK